MLFMVNDIHDEELTIAEGVLKKNVADAGVEH